MENPYQIELEDTQGDDDSDEYGASEQREERGASVYDDDYSSGAADNVNDADGEAGPTAAEIKMVRSVIVAIAISLLWLTTLSLAEAIVKAGVDKPTSQHVINTWENTLDDVQGAENDHIMCATNQMFTCGQLLNGTSTSLTSSTAGATEANQNVVLDAEFVTGQCGIALQSKMVSLRAYKAVLDDLGENDRSIDGITYSCKGPQLSKMQSEVMLSKKAANVNKTLVFAVADQAKAEGTFWGNLADSLANRTMYDIMYAASQSDDVSSFNGQIEGYGGVPSTANITGEFETLNTDFNEMATCYSLEPGCNDPNSLYFIYGNATEDARLKWQKTSDAMDEQERNLQNVQKAVKEEEVKFEATKREIEGWNAFFEAQPKGVLDVSCCSFPDPPELSPVPDIEWDSPDLPEMPSRESLMGEIKFDNILTGVEIDMAEQQNKLETELEANVDQIKSDIKDVEAPGLEDYDPPPLTVDEDEKAIESAEWQNTAQATLGELSNLTDTVITVNVTTQGGDVIGAIKSGLSDFKSPNFLLEELSGALDVKPFFTALDTFWAVCLASDYIYRVLNTIRIIVTYWFRSGANLPYIDIRKFRSSKKTSMPVLIARAATHPIVLFGGAAFLAFLGITVLVSAYSPSYHAYVAGCTVDQAPGSLISNNTNTIMFNYAMAPGNKELEEGLQDYDSARARTCGLWQDSSFDDYTSNVDALKLIRIDYADHKTYLDLIKDCLEPSELERLPLGYVVDWTNASDFLAVEAQCNIAAGPSTGSLVDNTFNCTKLPPCTHTCTGKSRDNERAQFRTSVQKATCTTEWLLHATILRGIMTGIVFICLNISRVFCMMALARTMWRHLTPKGLTFMGTCTRTGEMDESAKVDLVVQLEKMISKYNQWTKLYAACGFGIHLPWIILMVYFASNITV